MKRWCLFVGLFCWLVCDMALAVPHRWTPKMGSPFGINIHTFAWNNDPKAVKAINDLGVGWVRVDFNWFFMEPKKGQFNWQVSDGLVKTAIANNWQIFATLAYPPAWAATGAKLGQYPPPNNAADWARFVETVVKRYKGKISHWGIWNEPNLQQFLYFPSGTSRAQKISTYINRILLPGIQAVKKADPDAVAVAPDLAHLSSTKISAKDHSWGVWLPEILKKAGSKLDIFAHHIYKDDFPRWLDGQVWPWEFPNIRDHLKAAKVDTKPFWLTEVGWHTADVSEAKQSTEIIRVMNEMLKRKWWNKVFLYELRDDANIKEKWGLYRANWSAKPAVGALRNYILKNQPVPRFRSVVLTKVGVAVTLDASASTDPNGKIVKYSWDFDHRNGVQQNATGAKVTTRFAKAGTYQVTLTVTDDSGISIGVRKAILVQGGTTPPQKSYTIQHTASAPKIDGDLSDWRGANWVRLDGKDYVSLRSPHGGNSDLSAEFAWQWTSAGLYFAAKVTDNSHANSGKPNALWDGDSIQIAIDADGDRSGPGYDKDGDYEWTLGLVGGRARWEKNTSPAGSSASSPRLSIKRIGTQTIYEALFSSSSVTPLQLRAGAKFGLSLLVNDDDGKGRKGWIQWSAGIGKSKNPSQFPIVTLGTPSVRPEPNPEPRPEPRPEPQAEPKPEPAKEVVADEPAKTSEPTTPDDGGSIVEPQPDKVVQPVPDNHLADYGNRNDSSPDTGKKDTGCMCTTAQLPWSSLGLWCVLLCLMVCRRRKIP